MGKIHELQKRNLVPMLINKTSIGSGGIRTHAPEETGALIQRLRPLGHATCDGEPHNIVFFLSHADDVSAKTLYFSRYPLSYNNCYCVCICSIHPQSYCKSRVHTFQSSVDRAC